MDNLRVQFLLETVHCDNEGDGIGRAEPYLWLVFFKIDGDGVVLSGANLRGHASVFTRSGDHEDLSGGVEDGDDVPIAPSLGSFQTILKPIPGVGENPPAPEVGGLVGCAVVLLEQDSTPDAAVEQGHLALNRAVREELDKVIPTLGVLKQDLTDAELAAIFARVRAAILAAIRDHVNVLDFIFALGNMDDLLGSTAFMAKHEQLAAAGPAGIDLHAWFTQRFVQIKTASRPAPFAFRPGDYTSATLTGVQSVSLPAGWVVRLFSMPGFGGVETVLRSSDSVTGLAVRSLKVSMGAVRLFTRADFQGEAVEIAEPGHYDRDKLDALGVRDNRITSLLIPVGWRVTAFANPGFEGDSVALEGNVSRVRAPLASRISSLLVERSDDSSGDGEWEIRGRIFASVAPPPPPPLRTMVVQFDPPPQPDKRTTLTVRAVDAETKQPVAGRVFVDGKDVAPTNERFGLLMRTRVVKKPFDEPGDPGEPTLPGHPTIDVRISLTRVTVIAAGYRSVTLLSPGDEV